MSEEQQERRQWRRDEKEEKEEKEHEKEEKSWEEKWRRDPLSAAVWAIILIWLGLVLLASNLEVFARFEFMDFWPIFFIGAGVILLLEVVFRLLVPAYRQPVTGGIILAIVFLAIGLGGLTDNWNIIWALVVIGIGVTLLARGLLGRR